MADRLLTPDEAAQRIGGPVRLSRLVRTGKLAYVHVGRGKTLASYRFQEADIAAALEAMKLPGAPTVYVVGFAVYVKIGFTTDLAGRLLDLEEHLPEKLTLYASFPGAIADERRLHVRFASCRLRGEWFQKRGKLRSWIASGCIPEANDAP